MLQCGFLWKFDDVGASVFVARATFGDFAVLLFVTGATCRDVAVSLLLAGVHLVMSGSQFSWQGNAW